MKKVPNVNLRENALHSRPANEPNPAPPTIRWHNVAVRRMACISEMLGERRRVMMRMRDAKWRVYIASEMTNRWLTSSPSAGLTIGNIGWNRGQDQADATILAKPGPSRQWLADIQLWYWANDRKYWLE